MPARHSSAAASAVAVLLLSFGLAFAPRAGAGEPAPSRAARFKQVQRTMLRQEALERLEQARESARERAKHRGRHAARRKAEVRMEQPRDVLETGGAQGVGAAARAAVRPTALPAGAHVFAANVRVNNPALDPIVSPPAAPAGQGEQSIAAFGNFVLVAFNDGAGFMAGTDGQGQGYAYSVDGGQTFRDGGSPPILPGWTWFSDPVVTVNEKTGAFYYCGLVSPTVSTNGVAVVKGTFQNIAGRDTLIWGTPKLTRTAFSNGSGYAIDKQWIVADSSSGRLYISYTVFNPVTGDEIDFQRSNPNDEQTWSTAFEINTTGDRGAVQGSRPVVDGAGTIYVVWSALGPITPPYYDFFRCRKSTGAGAAGTFSAQATVASIFTNFSSGAPGFNRERGITFPSVTVDRGFGPHRGRVYVAWNESIDFYDDLLSTGSFVKETEPNNVYTQANTFVLGDSLRGTISTTSDFDWFKFTGTAGQTVIISVDSLDAGMEMYPRLIASDGTTRLALSDPGTGFGGLFVFTLPSSGTYYIRPASVVGSGGYKISTGVDVPSPGLDHARDHRDVMVASSDNGSTWSTPVVVNNDAAHFDNWLPEVGCDPAGHVFAIWYDWRDAPAATCGGVSHVYLARSDNGGGSWITLGPVTDAQTSWTSVASNIAPNQGDYMALFVNGTGVYPAWADGRSGDPDVWTAPIALATPTQVSLASATASPDQVDLRWDAPGENGTPATIERSDGIGGDVTGGPWHSIGSTVGDVEGSFRWTDRAITAGDRYGYRITLLRTDGPVTSTATWVDVPSRLGFALAGVRPNPTDRDLWVTFTLPDGAPASLAMLDVAGRRVRTMDVGTMGAGSHVVSLAAGARLEPGVYLVRLTRGDQVLTTRATVIR